MHESPSRSQGEISEFLEAKMPLELNHCFNKMKNLSSRSVGNQEYDFLQKHPSQEIEYETLHSRSNKLGLTKENIKSERKKSKATSKRVQIPPAQDSKSIVIPHRTPQLTSLFATLGKISHVIKKTKEIIKYKNFKNLTMKQMSIIQDSANFVVSDKEIFQKSKDCDTRESQNMLKMKKILEKTKKIAKKFPVFHPSNRIVIIWKAFICLYILFDTMSMTIKLFFQRNWDNEYSLVETYRLTFKIFLVFDIILNLNTGIYRSGTVVTARGEIVKHYMKEALFNDFIPLVTIFLPYFGEKLEGNGPALIESSKNIFKLLFLLKLFQVKKVFEVLGETLIYDETHEATLSLIGLLSEVLLIAHIICCMWNLAAWVELQNGNSCWYEKSIYDSVFILPPWWKVYLYSYYWSLTTMITVGYGDISPKGEFEVVIASLSMLLGCGFFAYAINRIGIILEKFSLKEKNFRKDLRIIKKFMRNKRVEYELQVRVCKYLENMWLVEEFENRENEQNVFKKLSESLRKDLLLSANGRIISNFPTFTNHFSDDILEKLTERLEFVNFAPGDLIYKEGQTEDTRVYFLNKGEVMFYLGRDKLKASRLINTIKAGECFGQLSFFTGGPRNLEARSAGFSSLYYITRENFLNILASSQNDWEIFHMIKDNIHINQSFEDLGVKCDSCGDSSHLFNNCPFLNYLANKELLIRKLQYSEPQKRRKYERSKNIRGKNGLFYKDIVPPLTAASFSEINSSSAPNKEKSESIDLEDIPVQSQISIDFPASRKDRKLKSTIKIDSLPYEERADSRLNSFKFIEDPTEKASNPRRKRKSTYVFKEVEEEGEEGVEKEGVQKEKKINQAEPEFEIPHLVKEHNNPQAEILPMIFGGLNTEKMASFETYFPYNNAEAVVSYFAKINKIKKKKSKSRLSLSVGRTKINTTGLIYFRNMKTYHKRNIKPKQKKPVKKKHLILNVFRRNSARLVKI